MIQISKRNTPENNEKQTIAYENQTNVCRANKIYLEISSKCANAQSMPIGIPGTLGADLGAGLFNQ